MDQNLIDIQKYNQALSSTDYEIADTLFQIIIKNLPHAECKIWHGHPVWFLDGNPIVGYSKLKNCIRLLFWSGQSFNEEKLKNEGKFKAAEIRYENSSEINATDLEIWLNKSCKIQWDYKNLIKRKGELIRIK